MKTAGAIATKALTSRTFWIVVLVLLIVFIVWKSWAYIEALFKRDVTDYTQDAALSEARKRELDQLAQQLFAEMDGWNANPWNRPVLDQVNQLNNTELRYLAGRYPSYSNGETLKDAIDSESIPGDVDAVLISRLSAMNKSNQ